MQFLTCFVGIGDGTDRLYVCHIASRGRYVPALAAVQEGTDPLNVCGRAGMLVDGTSQSAKTINTNGKAMESLESVKKCYEFK